MIFISFPSQETKDESAVLWLDEIQDGIFRSNKETEDAQRCMYLCSCCSGIIVHFSYLMRYNE